jgi:hypothetical protein
VNAFSPRLFVNLSNLLMCQTFEIQSCETRCSIPPSCEGSEGPGQTITHAVGMSEENTDVTIELSEWNLYQTRNVAANEGCGLENASKHHNQSQNANSAPSTLTYPPGYPALKCYQRLYFYTVKNIRVEKIRLRYFAVDLSLMSYEYPLTYLTWPRRADKRTDNSDWNCFENSFTRSCSGTTFRNFLGNSNDCFPCRLGIANQRFNRSLDTYWIS